MPDFREIERVNALDSELGARLGMEVDLAERPACREPRAIGEGRVHLEIAAALLDLTPDIGRCVGEQLVRHLTRAGGI